MDNIRWAAMIGAGITVAIAAWFIGTDFLISEEHIASCHDCSALQLERMMK